MGNTVNRDRLRGILSELQNMTGKRVSATRHLMSKIDCYNAIYELMKLELGINTKKENETLKRLNKTLNEVNCEVNQDTEELRKEIDRLKKELELTSCIAESYRQGNRKYREKLEEIRNRNKDNEDVEYHTLLNLKIARRNTKFILLATAIVLGVKLCQLFL